jgi:hypothetical protein
MRRQIKIGTMCDTRFGSAKVTKIELCEQEGDKEGIPVNSIWVDLKDRCLFIFDNGHWQYGYQVEPSRIA